MTNALQNWGKKGTGTTPSDSHVTETDISGVEGDHDSQLPDGEHQEFADSDLPDGQNDAVVGDEREARAEPVPAKKPMQKYAIVALGAIVVLMLVGIVLKKMGGGHPAQQEVAAPQESAEQFMAQPGPQHAQDAGQGQIAQPAADSETVAPVIGAQPEAPLQPASAPGGASDLQPVVPNGMPTAAHPAGPSGQVAASAPALTQRSQVPPTPVAAPAQPDQALVARISALEAEKGSLADELSRLKGDLNQLQSKVAKAAGTESRRHEAAPRAARVEAPKVKKPAEESQEKPSEKVVAQGVAIDTSKSAVPSQAQRPSTKLRTDYRIYAVVEGKVWVNGRGSEPMLVDVRYRLDDGSIVEKIAADEPAVYTSKGEIR